MRDEAFLVGRILLSVVFIRSGLNHLLRTEGSVQYAAYKKVPWPRAMVLFTGVAMLAGAVAIVLGIWMDLAALLLAAFVLIAAFVMHRFWEATDPQARAAEEAQFMKNIAIAGAGVILAAVGTVAPYTITDGVF